MSSLREVVVRVPSSGSRARGVNSQGSHEDPEHKVKGRAVDEHSQGFRSTLVWQPRHPTMGLGDTAVLYVREMGHQHSHDRADDAVDGPLGRRLKLGGAALLVAALVAMAAMWPRGNAPDLGVQPQDYVNATVSTIDRAECPGMEADSFIGCREVTVELTSGPESGTLGLFLVLDSQLDVPELSAGDQIVLRDVRTAPDDFRYTYSDRQREKPLVGLAVVFVVVVLIFGRWQGLRALVGLALGVAILILFLVPALLRDEPAVLAAGVAGVVMLGLALYLAHGFSVASSIALFGTVASLALVSVLAIAGVAISRFSGLANADAQVLSVTADALDLRGLLLASMVIGTLGSLDDVTVSQVSTVAALRRANPGMGVSRLYREATSVGRDHVASSVNTLVLAYAGASLPLMLLFAQGSQPFGRILTSEVVAIEVVRMLVGSIGLIASVPITTALAAYVIGRDATEVEIDGPSVNAGADESSGPQWDDFGPDPSVLGWDPEAPPSAP